MRRLWKDSFRDSSRNIKAHLDELEKEVSRIRKMVELGEKEEYSFDLPFDTFRGLTLGLGESIQEWNTLVRIQGALNLEEQIKKEEK